MTCNLLCPAEQPDSLPDNRGTNRIFAVISVLHVMESGPNHYQMAGHFLTADPNLGIECSFLIATVIVHLTASHQISNSNSSQQKKEICVTIKHLRHFAFVGAVTLALSASTEADQLQKQADTGLALAIVGVAAVVTVVVVAVHHSAANHTVTGCVNAAPNGITVSDDKNKRIYVLSGDTVGIKPGDRMMLRLKRIKSKGSNAPTWETKNVIKDFGLCQS
jgi:hypothetical protein